MNRGIYVVMLAFALITTGVVASGATVSDHG